MDNDTLITRAEGGTQERQVRTIAIEIPDLWHIAIRLPDDDQAAVLECWHLAHDLLKHIKGE